MRYLAIVLILGATALAAEPTTRPKDVAPKDRPAELIVGQVIDARLPAQVPTFAKADKPPVGNFAERDWARTNTLPAPILFGCGYGYWGFGCGGGLTTHAFFR